MPSDDMSYYAILNRPLAAVNEKLWVPGAPVVGSAGESRVLFSVPMYSLFLPGDLPPKGVPSVLNLFSSLST